MELVLTDTARLHIAEWKKTGNITALRKIQKLLANMQQTPFSGEGQPEPLKYKFSGLWSRRINQEHRIVYHVENNVITILSLKGHYN